MVDSTCRVVGIHRHVNMKCTALFLLFLTVTLAYQDNDGLLIEVYNEYITIIVIHVYS